jgi:hypothetical protein
MKQKVQFTLFSLVLIIFLILISCNEPNIIENTVVGQEKVEANESRTNSSLNKQIAIADTGKKGIRRKDIKGKIITDDKAPICNRIVVERWGLDRYEPKPGKTIGIWLWGSEYTTSNLYYLRTHWGYSGLFSRETTTDYDNAISAGYSKQNIMQSINTPNYETLINTKDAGYYYIDEAVNHGWVSWNPTPGSGHRFYHLDELTDVASYIHTNRPNSKFVSSGFKRCIHLDILVNTLLDEVMYSSYKKWWNYYTGAPISVGDDGVAWPPYSENIWADGWPFGSEDQRGSWSDMENRYSNKFSMTWISTSRDAGEYTNLFGKAKSLNLNAVWIYALYSNANQHYYEISRAAWNADYLRRFERKYWDVYYCYEPDPCINCEHPDAHWYWSHSYDTGIEREVYP